MSYPFTLTAHESHDESSGDEMAADSDFEHLASVEKFETSDTVNYWFGRLELMHRLAISIASGVSPTASESDLELALTKRMATIPYSDRLTRAQSECAGAGSIDTDSSGNNPFGIFVTLLGSAALKSGSKHKALINNLMMGEGNHQCDDDDADSLAVRHNRDNFSRNDSQFRQPESIRAIASTNPDLPRYTALLKEYGDSSGDVPLYEDNQVTFNPPFFEAVVHVGSLSFRGKAKTKKQAKHLASQQACQHLRIGA